MQLALCPANRSPWFRGRAQPRIRALHSALGGRKMPDLPSTPRARLLHGDSNGGLLGCASRTVASNLHSSKSFQGSPSNSTLRAFPRFDREKASRGGRYAPSLLTYVPEHHLPHGHLCLGRPKAPILHPSQRTRKHPPSAPALALAPGRSWNHQTQAICERSPSHHPPKRGDMGASLEKLLFCSMPRMHALIYQTSTGPKHSHSDALATR